MCEQLEKEVAHLRNEEKSRKVKEKFENSSTILDNILKSQRSTSSKTGLGYEQKKINGFQKFIKGQSKSYAEMLIEESKKRLGAIQSYLHYIQPSIGVGFKIFVGDPLFFPLDVQTKGGVVVGTTLTKLPSSSLSDSSLLLHFVLGFGFFVFF